MSNRFPKEMLEAHVDSVLRAAGSALRHYSIEKTRHDMREAMASAMQAACDLEGKDVDHGNTF